MLLCALTEWTLKSSFPRSLNYISMPGTAHFSGSADDSISTSTHLLRRSFNRFFFTCSFGLRVAPSSHESTLPTVTVCSSSGALTRILNGVAGPNVISAKAPRRNAAMASIRSFIETLGGNANGGARCLAVCMEDEAKGTMEVPDLALRTLPRVFRYRRASATHATPSARPQDIRAFSKALAEAVR